jgi:predicted naringenin-chalcone synthase
MGCYAAIHGMKMADAFCKADPDANVMVVCTELCTLHFQKDWSEDNITSSMLFGDGSSAILVQSDTGKENEGPTIDHFYSQVATKGKSDMAWKLSSKGFLMTLSSYVADLIEEDFKSLVNEALSAKGLTTADIDHWCIHPGGRKILEAVHRSLGFTNGQLDACYDVLKQFGNMSSATVLFVLKKMQESGQLKKGERIFGAAFGPGLTMETFILTV